MTILVSQIFSGLFGFQLIRVQLGDQDVYVFTEIALRLVNFKRGKGHKKHSIENQKGFKKEGQNVWVIGTFGRCVREYRVTAQVQVHSHFRTFHK